MLNALLLSLAIGQATNVGTLLATRGGFTFMGWDGAQKKAPKLGESLALADEISTEGDGSVKVSLAEVAVVTLGGSTKLTFDKLEGTAMVVKLGYGRVRVTVTPERPVSLNVTTAAGQATVADGDVVVIVEGDKTQVVVLSGTATTTSAQGSKDKLTAGMGCNAGGAPYGVSAASLQALRRSLELDETPSLQIAQSLETDLPGFVGPKSGHTRWRGMAETVGEGAHLAPPFDQYPAGAIAR